MRSFVNLTTTSKLVHCNFCNDSLVWTHLCRIDFPQQMKKTSSVVVAVQADRNSNTATTTETGQIGRGIRTAGAGAGGSAEVAGRQAIRAFMRKQYKLWCVQFVLCVYLYAMLDVFMFVFVCLYAF